MASLAYSAQFANKSGAEHLPADYTLVNNTGASLTIDLTTLTADLHDADGDPITINGGYSKSGHLFFLQSGHILRSKVAP
jgi:hypothetical protein